MSYRALPSCAGPGALSPSDLGEAEFAKDVWDVRKIPGARYKMHESDHLLNFADVPTCYRPLVQRSMRHKLTTIWSHSRCQNVLLHLRLFLHFWVWYAPAANGFQQLSSAAIDSYLTHLRGTPNRHGRPKSAEQVWLAVNALDHFLRYRKRINSSLAPACPIETSVWPEHTGKRPRPTLHGKKHIPEVVLRQLNEHINALPAAYRPVVVLLLASGWRIADVLNLRYDTCLESRWDRERQCLIWDLVGDIAKTRVLRHHIPLTTEVATLVQAQCTLVQEQDREENPHRYLFPALRRKNGRSGRPLAAGQVRYALNKLADQCAIRGDDGQIFHFQAHAFRHTKAVELINNGMPLVYVQQWLAHLSPEMTAIYARIQADTMRRQWEQTTAHGVVQFRDGAPEYVHGKQAPPMLDDDGSFAPLRVREHRVNVRMPLGTCTKTEKMVCRFFELPCFHCAAYVLTPDDLPALERYEAAVVARIQMAGEAHNDAWAACNRQNLETRIRPALALLRVGKVYAKASKHEREYTPEEWAQRQAARGGHDP